MKLKMEKKCEGKDFNLAYAGWNDNKMVRQGFIFHVIIYNCLVNILLIQLKSLKTLSCLSLNYGTSKQ